MGAFEGTRPHSGEPGPHPSPSPASDRLPPRIPAALTPWSPPEDADADDEPLGGEPPCMAHLLDEQGMMPDRPSRRGEA
jgi:hypothetical protein